MFTIRLQLNENDFKLWWNKDDPVERDYSEADRQMFRTLIDEYGSIVKSVNIEKRMLSIGKTLYTWLDGFKPGWLDDYLKNSFTSSPLIIEYSVSPNPSPDELLFLEVPWELLVKEEEFLALDRYKKYTPVRRLGKEGEKRKPREYRLSLLFMAAAPRGEHKLDFEGEESAILKAAEDDIELLMEESGTLKWLSKTYVDESPDVLHLSCHGQSLPEPKMLFENEEGGKDEVFAERLASELGEKKPGLLFLSACETSHPGSFLNSYSTRMVRHGFPSVLGWGGNVQDREATLFASGLYHFLTKQDSIPNALAEARFKLFTDMAKDETVCNNWHLARLYLGEGGGKLTAGSEKKRIREDSHGIKTFLNTKEKEIPVAGRYEFVGRRRQIQECLREIRKPNRAGTVIHGIGNQGKSSLAARLSNRLEEYNTVVVYKRYSASHILRAIDRTIVDKNVHALCEEYKPIVEDEPDRLLNALRELLTGPLSRAKKKESGGYKTRPILLVLDDFERILTPPAQHETLYKVNASHTKTVKALIRAFELGETDSRLLITSRYTFTLTEGEADYSQKLHFLPLPSMSEAESRKQLARKVENTNIPVNEDNRKLLVQCLEAGRGNPGLQNLISGLCIEEPEAGQKVLHEIKDYLTGTKESDNQKVQDFLKRIALENITALLQESEKAIIRASAFFTLPLPVKVMRKLITIIGSSDSKRTEERLTGFGIWDVYEDILKPRAKAYRMNMLFTSGPLAPSKLTEEEAAFIAKEVVNLLYDFWSEPVKEDLPDAVQYELARLALLAEDISILQKTAHAAMVHLDTLYNLKDGAKLGRDCIRVLDKHTIKVDIKILRKAAELNHEIGKSKTANEYIQRAACELEDKKELTFDEASVLVQLSRQLVHNGEPDRALTILTRCSDCFKKGEYSRDAAVTLGDIARILRSKGEVDRALDMFGQAIKTFEELGDRGETAHALFHIGHIELYKEMFQEAFDHLAESYRINMKLGRLDGISFVGQVFGQLLAGVGLKDEALIVLIRSFEGFTKLGLNEYAEQTRQLIEQVEKK